MRIAIIIPSLSKTAPIELVRMIVKSILQANSEVVVFHFGNKDELIFPCRTVRLSYFEYYSFSEFDIVHSHLFKSDVYAGVFLKLFRKKNRPILISTLHNDIISVMRSYHGKFLSFFLSRIWYYAIKNLDLIICLSETQREFLNKEFKIHNTYTIYNGSTISSVKTNDVYTDFLTSLRKSFKVIGMVVNLYKLKGIDQVISSLVYLDEFALVIIGSGPEKTNLMNLAVKLGVDGRCVFLGHIDDGHAFNKYFDVFVMSSHSEGFGISVLEAAQYRQAVVCSNLDLYQELYTDNEVVFFKLGNINSLVSSISLAYTRKHLLGENLHNKYKNSYTTEHMTSNYINLYISIINKI